MTGLFSELESKVHTRASGFSHDTEYHTDSHPVTIANKNFHGCSGTFCSSLETETQSQSRPALRFVGISTFTQNNTEKADDATTLREKEKFATQDLQLDVPYSGRVNVNGTCFSFSLAG